MATRISLRWRDEVRTESARAIEEAERYDLSDADPSHFSPAQIETVEEAFPDFPAMLTSQELRQIRGVDHWMVITKHKELGQLIHAFLVEHAGAVP